MSPETILIILNIILILIGLYLALLKSYFQEKGKNIATSEDIEGLTLKVESVKQQFLEKNANLKAKLDLLTNLQISHKNDERSAIIEFHKKIKSWIGLLTEGGPTLADDYDNNEIKAKIHYYDLAYREFLAAEALLELYIEDEELKTLIYTLKISTMENLVPHPSECLLKLKHNNFLIEQLDSEQDYEVRGNKHEKLLIDRKTIFAEYRENMMKGYEIIIPHDKTYRDYVREYISKIPDQ